MAFRPDVGEAVVAVELLGVLLQGVSGSRRSDLRWPQLAEQGAQVQEVGLGRSPLTGGHAAPLRGELGGG